MPKNNTRTKRVLHVSLVLCLLVTLLVAVSLGSVLVALVRPELFGVVWAPEMVPALLLHLVLISVLVVMGKMLWALGRDYTPFTVANICRLKMVGLLLMLLEPLQWAAVALLNALRPLTEGGIKVTHFNPGSGGVVLVAGLVLFCFAAAFKRGAELQQQADETL